MAHRLVIVGGSEAGASEIRIELEEFSRLCDELAVLRDVNEALVTDRARLRAENEALRTALLRPSANAGEGAKRAGKSAAPGKRRMRVPVQYGALPYQVTKGGSLELLLVATKQSERWALPKGRRIKGKKPAKCAAREAFEEAGIRGVVAKKSIGAFHFVKAEADGPAGMREVRIFPLKVKRELRPAKAPRRMRRWFAPSAALAAVDDAGLKSVINRFVETMAPPARLN